VHQVGVQPKIYTASLFICCC